MTSPTGPTVTSSRRSTAGPLPGRTEGTTTGSPSAAPSSSSTDQLRERRLQPLGAVVQAALHPHEGRPILRRQRFQRQPDLVFDHLAGKDDPAGIPHSSYILRSGT